MLPLAHFLAVARVDQAAPDEGAQNPLARHGLNIGDGDCIQPARGIKDHAPFFLRVGDGLEYPVDDTAMEMHMLVQT